MRKVSFVVNVYNASVCEYETETRKGFFHQWGIEPSEELGSSESVAIVEMSDGSIQMPLATLVTFVIPYKENKDDQT